MSTFSVAGGWVSRPDWRLVTELDHTSGATKNDLLTARVQVVF